MPTPRPIRWLHLSDLHLGCRGEDLWWQMQTEWEPSVRAMAERLGAPDLVLISGDLANRGEPEEYGLVGLNSTWQHYKEGEFRGKLTINRRQFHAALPPGAGGNPLEVFKRHRCTLLTSGGCPDPSGNPPAAPTANGDESACIDPAGAPCRP